jgi:phage terminase large subunit
MIQTIQKQILTQTVNSCYKPLFTENKRYYHLMGGRSAGRSYVASQFALANLRSSGYFRCAIMRYIRSDIRNSIFQEIVDRIEERDIDDVTIKQNLVFEHEENSIVGIGFKKSSNDQKSKLKSLANFNCIIIEEADEISEEDFMQLDDSLRTLKSDIKIILLYNPPAKQHWLIRRFFNLDQADVEGYYIPTLKPEHRNDTVFIHTTYKDNLSKINKSTRKNFERYKQQRPDHYYNMIEGLVSEGARGRIYTKWERISDAEYDALPYPVSYGLDFGFSNDPTSFNEIKTHNNKVYVKELIYRTGLTNDDISKEFKRLGVQTYSEIIADSAEPKSIEELRRLGWNVIATDKGADSIRAGIDLLLSKEVYYTESSESIDNEVQEYKWALDRNKEPTNDPIDDFNHAMDAIRYNIFTRSKAGIVGFA